jgi:hypothetical protein
VSDFPDNSTLLALAEVCATLLGFVGVVVVLGRRSAGEWNDMERARFLALLTCSISALVLSLLPLVLSDANSIHAAVVVCGVSLYLVAHAGMRAIRHPEGSNSIAITVATGSLLAFLAVTLNDAGLWLWNLGELYLSLILWHIGVACLFFVRLIRVATN